MAVCGARLRPSCGPTQRASQAETRPADPVAWDVWTATRKRSTGSARQGDVTPWLCFEGRRGRPTGRLAAPIPDGEKPGSLAAGPARKLLGRSTGRDRLVRQPRDAGRPWPPSSFGDAPADAACGRRHPAGRFGARNHGIVLPFHAFAGKIWLRISAQIYNQIDDYRRCAELSRAAAKSLGLAWP